MFEEKLRMLDFKPSNTAIARSGPSAPAKAFAKVYGGSTVRTILDFGCGRGADVQYLKKLGFTAVGYDPYEPFGSAKLPIGVFDAVLMTFVLNVLPTVEERDITTRTAVQLLRQGGVFVVTTRSGAAVNREAAIRHWTMFNDGYVSNERRRTFQKGFSIDELRDIASRNGLKELPRPRVFTLPDATILICTKI